MSKTCLCLGTGPGIGLATAIRFAKEGYRPILAARNVDKLQALADAVHRASGQTADVVRIDAGDHSQMVDLAQQLGNIDVLHYNAAIVHGQTLQQAGYTDLQNDVQVGLSGALFAVKAFAPAMLERRSGSLLLTGGVLGIHPEKQYLTLGLVKAGLRNLAEALFPECAEHNVHLTCVTVSCAVAPDSPEAAAVADLFWKIHCQPRERWTWESFFAI